MAFLRTANAKISKASLQPDDWNNIRSGTLGGKMRVSSEGVNLSDYAPDKFLLTHCTIIASVDVDQEGPQNDKGWFYHVTPETEKYVNNNSDSWERDLLLATFHTFRGAENYVEHIQIPELSKGKILDAVARDIGDSIYVDILVATNRKHEELVKDIEEENISTLSMGCTVEYTICTKCGNVAHDDTEMCACIKYAKGNHFYDKRGIRRKIAELCGHKSDPASVTFIEASWVANPAFKGAVKRNIISPEEVEEAAIKAAFETERIVDTDAMQKAASTTDEVRKAFQVVSKFIRSGQFDFSDDPDAQEPGTPAEEKQNLLDELGDDVKEFVRTKVRQELREEIESGGEPKPYDPNSEDTNDTLVESSEQKVREGFAFSAFKKKFANYGSDLMLYRLYEGLVSIKTGGWKSLAAKGFSGREILALSFFIDKARGKTDPLDKKAYDAISKLGGTAKFDDPKEYLSACGRHMGVTRMSTEQAKALIYKGQLYSYGAKA